MEAKTNLETATKLAKKKLTPCNKDSAKSVWLEDYLDCFTFKLKPVTEQFIERLAKELFDWAKNDKNALRVSDFCWNKGIPEKTYYKWIKEHEVLQLAHEAAIHFIGSRRENGAINKKYSETIILKSQYKYDSMWAQIRADDKQDKIDVATTISKTNADALSKQVFTYERRIVPDLQYASDKEATLSSTLEQ